MASSLINAAITTDRVGSLNAVPVALAAVTVQWTGFSLSFMICAAFLYRLMTQKLPQDAQRPGVVSPDLESIRLLPLAERFLTRK